MDLQILPQPKDVTCGQTSLHVVYSYPGYDISHSNFNRGHHENSNEKMQFLVRNPDCTNPMKLGIHNKVTKPNPVHSISLDVMTYDGNIPVLEKK